MSTLNCVRQLVTPATLKAISVDDCRTRLRISDTFDDLDLDLMIDGVTDATEQFLNKALLTQTWKLFIDSSFPDVIELPRPPLQSVTSITYIDSDGAEQTVATSVYDVDTNSLPGRIFEKHNQTWPSDVRDQINAITIEYKAGYTSAALVPGAIKNAMLMHVGHLYENREAVIIGQGFTSTVVPMGVQNALTLHRFLNL